MVHITRKKIKGHYYLYLEERAYIKGKSRRVWQKYLGPEDKIKEMAFTARPGMMTYQTLEFGGSGALLEIARRIKLVETLDRHTQKTRDQGLSVGEYLLIAIINRCVAPTSKRQFGRWFQRDYLSRVFKVESQVLNSQTYWNHFHYFSPELLEQIERDLSKTVLEEFQLDLDCVLFDPTNFYTFISEHEEGQLAQFGHSKEGRNGLRIVNLSLLCTMDSGIPLFHRTYEGNTQDAKHFRSVLKEIFERFQFLNREVREITLVFDKGNHSKKAFDTIAADELGFIASLRNSTQKDLLQLPDKAFTFFHLPANGKEVGYYRTTREIYGVPRVVYVIHDPRKQKKSLLFFERKLQAKLDAIQTFLQTSLNIKKWRSEEAVRKKLETLIGRIPFREIIQLKIKGPFGQLQVTIFLNEVAKTAYCQTLGRSVIFTNRDDWLPENVIQVFRNKYLVEDIFKHLKNPAFLSIRPMYHWADECVRMHVFCCVMGFLLLSLLRRILHEHGVKASYREIVKAFAGLKVTEIRPSPKAPSLLKLNRVEGLPATILKIFHLERLLPHLE